MSIKNIFRLGTIAAGLLAAINAGHASPGTKEQVEEYLELEGQYLYYPGKSAAAKTEIPMTHLVIGSTRFPKGMTPLIAKIVSAENENLLHQETFSGGTTTVDLEACHLPGARHLQTNAATYNFLTGIKRLCLERLPTSDEHSYDLIERILKNIMPKLASPAVVEIEWDPYVTRGMGDQIERLKTCYKDLFHGFFDINVMHNAAQIAFFNYESLNNCPADILAAAHAEVPLINELIHGYSKKIDVSEQCLKEHLRREWIIFNELIKEQNQKYYVGMESSPSESIEKFKESFENVIFGFCEFSDPTTFKYQGKVFFNESGFSTHTIYNHLFADITVIKNSPNVKSYLEKLGFTDVRIQQTVNPHNGRQHVWMIRAFKP